MHAQFQWSGGCEKLNMGLTTKTKYMVLFGKPGHSDLQREGKTLMELEVFETYEK